MEENTVTNRSVHARRFYLFEDQDYMPKYLGHDKEGPCHGIRVDEALCFVDDHGTPMYYVKGRTLSRTIFGWWSSTSPRTS